MEENRKVLAIAYLISGDIILVASSKDSGSQTIFMMSSLKKHKGVFCMFSFEIGFGLLIVGL